MSDYYNFGIFIFFLVYSITGCYFNEGNYNLDLGSWKLSYYTLFMSQCVDQGVLADRNRRARKLENQNCRISPHRNSFDEQGEGQKAENLSCKVHHDRPKIVRFLFFYCLFLWIMRNLTSFKFLINRCLIWEIYSALVLELLQNTQNKV